MKVSNWLVSPGALARSGVLGMNARNRRYIGAHNPRRMFPLVDDKLRTKRLLEEHGLAAPRLMFVVRAQHEVRDVAARLPVNEGFCIKPAKGSGGKGILVVVRREGDSFIKGSGAAITLAQIQRHMSNALAGLFSLGGNPDAVLIEELIEPSPVFAGLSHEGVPDIRIVVYRGYPVMAMLRLATHASDGKANLHQGAIGVGIDIRSGACVRAVQHGELLQRHPDTDAALDAIRIDDWRAMLLLAARCHDITGLGYLGADLVLDARRGAQLLELNARPGLAIQVANGAGLRPRLEAIDERLVSLGEGGNRIERRVVGESVEERVDAAMDMFGRSA